MSSKRRVWKLLLLGCFGASVYISCVPVHAAQPVENHLEGTISDKDKIRVAATIKAGVEGYFAHWKRDQSDKFEEAFENYLAEISSTNDRKAFDFATLRLLASLQNGHTAFNDSWLWSKAGGRTGLEVVYQGDQWVVKNSARGEVPPGAVLSSIDGEAVNEFYKSKEPFISGSSDGNKRDHLFNISYLFPQSFSLKFSNGATAVVDRSQKLGFWRNPPTPKKLPQGIFYLPIWSFSNSKYEDDAVAFIRNHADAKVIIIDLRGNGGGSTPVKLLSAVMLEDYQNWNELSAMSVGLLNTYGGLAGRDNDLDPETKGYLSGMKDYFSRPMMYFPGAIVHPDKPVYRGRLIVLVDRACASACEDFVMPLKETRRATLIGESTFGSSGQPKSFDFGNGMTLRIGAKQMLFPDGSRFEGVGIAPDIRVSPSPGDIKLNNDPVLNKAVSIAE